MALSVPIRRDILKLLADSGRLSASAICQQFNVSASAVSQHLKILLNARLVKVERRAKQRIYQLDPAGVAELEVWAKQINRRFDHMENVLKEQRG